MISRQELYHQDDQGEELVRSLENHIFKYLKLDYQINQIPISQKEFIHTIYIQGEQKNQNKNYYLGHGFGGTSLMFFAVIQQLLKTGNVILWQLRGMGVSRKLVDYQISSIQDIELFYMENIKKLVLYYKYENSTFFCHSLSAYLMLLFAIRQPYIAKSMIGSLVLLSPAGITPKELDQKNQIHSVGDIFHVILNKFGWAFDLTYKSPLRTVLSCFKTSILNTSLEKTDLDQFQRQIMLKILQTLILLPDGSQYLFFKFFSPRVLPKIAIEDLMKTEPEIPITMVFGGEQDWVDKSGPKRLAEKYKDKIKIMIFQTQGHNFPFQKQACLNVIKQLFSK